MNPVEGGGYNLDNEPLIGKKTGEKTKDITKKLSISNLSSKSTITAKSLEKANLPQKLIKLCQRLFGFPENSKKDGLINNFFGKSRLDQQFKSSSKLFDFLKTVLDEKGYKEVTVDGKSLILTFENMEKIKEQWKQAMGAIGGDRAGNVYLYGIQCSIKILDQSLEITKK